MDFELNFIGIANSCYDQLIAATLTKETDTYLYSYAISWMLQLIAINYFSIKIVFLSL